MKRVVNYVGQLRVYSYADLLLLLPAVRADVPAMAGISLLWFGFLIHLEWRHQDAGRLRWPWYAWAGPWAVGAAIFHGPQVVPFLALAVGYALKKRSRSLCAISPLLNGGLKVALIALVPGVPAGTCALVFAVMTVRNLLGDMRDAAKDAKEGVGTIPVLLGLRTNTPWVYPAGLAFSSGLWTVLGDLPPWWYAVALLVQAATYHLTPR
ncbi:hypothetical protein GCM10017673_14220 [Streptosporangium violaceochromogenes]|nr:hypothetical protein GCM10017673_14220 [Streptosporangium violaceochromogenes]